jgi:hypothetical protein
VIYRVEQDQTSRKSFGSYTYSIYKGKSLVARYWHDHRGDEHGIEFLTGASESWPVGSMSDFLEGGGLQPLRLSEKATQYLDERLAAAEKVRDAAGNRKWSS